jgi:hypothetical protein
MDDRTRALCQKRGDPASPPPDALAGLDDPGLGLESATVNPTWLLSLNHRSLPPLPKKTDQDAIPSKSGLNRFWVIGGRPDVEVQEKSNSSFRGRQPDELDPVDGLSITDNRMLPPLIEQMACRRPWAGIEFATG